MLQICVDKLVLFSREDMDFMLIEVICFEFKFVFVNGIHIDSFYKKHRTFVNYLYKICALVMI